MTNSIFREMKTGTGFLLLQMMLSITAFAFGQDEPSVMIFVSSSMPDAAIRALQCQAGRMGPLVLRGLIDNSLQKTVIWSQKWISSNANRGQGFQINPVVFRQYHIDQVPAVLVRKGEAFAVVYGNVTLDYALKHIADGNQYDPAISGAARQALSRFKHDRGTAC